MSKGIFITIEGPDGAGKTTVLQAITPKLQFLSNKEILVTREPGGVAIAEQIREIILSKNNQNMDERTEALLFAASRRQHLIEKVMPALNKGDIVIADRYVDSSLAYQGVGRKLGVEAIVQLNDFAIEGFLPDLTLYFDVDTETGLERIRKNRSEEEVNRLDMDEFNFHQRVRHGYLKLAEQYPERIKKIDAKKTISEVADKAIETIIQQFPTEFNR